MKLSGALHTPRVLHDPVMIVRSLFIASYDILALHTVKVEHAELAEWAYYGPLI